MPRKLSNRKQRKSTSLEYGSLEQRQLLAFNFLFDGSTLTLNQSADDGVVMIDNSGAANEFRVNDGAGFVTYEAAENLIVNMMDNGSHLTMSLNSAHNGDLTINAGNGARNILFASAGNTIDGHLSISARQGNQVLSLAQIGDLEVGKGIEIDTGTGSDTLQFTNGLRVAGDLELTRVNDVNFDSALVVDGDVLVDNSAEVWISKFEKSNIVQSSISGRFSYLGSGEVDRVILQTIDIEGDINAIFGDGFTAGFDVQLLELIDVEFNNLLLQSGQTDNFDYINWFGTTANGNVVVDMGDGSNSASFTGFINGSTFDYSGGIGFDSVTYDLSGGVAQDVVASLGDGNDLFNLFNALTVNHLEIDFGKDDDQFFHAANNFTYDATLLNLDDIDVRYELASDTLTLDQRVDADNAILNLSSDNLTEQFEFATNSLTTATHLNVSMADNNGGGFTFLLDHILQGDLNVDVGGGDRNVWFQGGVNGVAGNFQFSSGVGAQQLFIDVAAPFFVDGDAAIDMGLGYDEFVVGNLIRTGGHLSLSNINWIELSGGLVSDGGVHIDASVDDQDTYLASTDQFSIDGNFTYIGNDQFSDDVRLAPFFASAITGDVFVDLGDNVDAALDQNVIFHANVSIGGNVTALSTSETMLDLFRTEGNSQIAGNINVDLGGGENIGSIRHEVTGGDFIRYVGGSATDQVILSTSGMPTLFNIILGEGDDLLSLEASTEIGDMLRIDFGGGGDVFLNGKGAITWDTRLLNFHGFNNFYDPATDSVRLFQLADTQDFSVSNVGAGDAFVVDFQDGTGYELTPAANLRIHMAPDSTTNMGIRFDNDLAGNLALNLGQDDHEVHFIGVSNTIKGNMWINGGQGNQNLYLADQNDLVVQGNTMINLRDGVDNLVDSGNALNFHGNLTLRNIDNFEVTNNLFVGGGMAMESLWYTQDVRFDNDGVTQIDGKFTYLGSDGSDQVLLNGNASIGDDIYIRLGENTSAGKNQIVDLTDGFQGGGRLAVVGANSMGGNIMLTDAATTIGGDVLINFSDSATSNTAILKGQYGGGYGTFRGGDADDSLVLDAIAQDMFWSTILNGGNDELTLEDSSDFVATFFDFGLGDDVFEDFSIEEYPKSLFNLP